MGDNKFGFYAWVHTPKQTQRIDMVSIGIWTQISGGKIYPPGTLNDLEAKFKGMVSKGKSPFNFYWTPYIDKSKKINQGTLFRDLSGKDTSTIELRVQIYDDTGNLLNTSYWNFYDVQKLRILPSKANEIVETVYANFDTGSKQP